MFRCSKCGRRHETRMRAEGCCPNESTFTPTPFDITTPAFSNVTIDSTPSYDPTPSVDTSTFDGFSGGDSGGAGGGGSW